MKTIKPESASGPARLLEVEKLLPDTGRKTADLATVFVLENPDFFSDILEACLVQTYPLSMRASRVIYLCAIEEPEIIRPYLSPLVDKLGELHDESVVRNFLHIYEHYTKDVDEEHLVKLIDLCFRYLEDPSRAIAIRGYAVNVLLEAAKRIPEISTELVAVLEFLIPDESRTFQGFAKRIVRKVKTSYPHTSKTLPS